MYAIETDLGRFEADTEKEAKAKLRKAQREAEKAAKEAEADRNIAYAMAGQTAWFLAKDGIDGRHSQHSWIVRPGDRFFPAKCDSDSRKWLIRADDSSTVQIELWGYRPLAMRIKPCGQVDLLWTQDIDNPERTYCLAVGVYGTQYATVEIPASMGITPEILEAA